jgi:hypothetical protein
MTSRSTTRRNEAACPRTAAFIRGIPAVQHVAASGLGEALFSALAPGTVWDRPHCHFVLPLIRSSRALSGWSHVGFGHIVALYFRTSAADQTHEENWCLHCV